MRAKLVSESLKESYQTLNENHVPAIASGDTITYWEDGKELDGKVKKVKSGYPDKTLSIVLDNGKTVSYRKNVDRWIMESYINEKEYRGEKQALAQGLDILTQPQLAAIYLAAKDAAGRSESNRGRGDNALTRNALKMNREETPKEFQRLSAPRLADVLGLKPRTVNYTLSKFRLLLSGNREGTYSNVLYNKIIDSFDTFEKMRVGDVYSLALEAVNMNADFSRSEEYQEQVSAQAKKSRENKIKKDAKIGYAAVGLFNGLKNTFGEKAPKMVINKLAKEYDMPAEAIRTIIKTYLKNDPIMARKF